MTYANFNIYHRKKSSLWLLKQIRESMFNAPPCTLLVKWGGEQIKNKLILKNYPTTPFSPCSLVNRKKWFLSHISEYCEVVSCDQKYLLYPIWVIICNLIFLSVGFKPNRLLFLWTKMSIFLVVFSLKRRDRRIRMMEFKFFASCRNPPEII